MYFHRVSSRHWPSPLTLQEAATSGLRKACSLTTDKLANGQRDRRKEARRGVRHRDSDYDGERGRGEHLFWIHTHPPHLILDSVLCVPSPGSSVTECTTRVPRARRTCPVPCTSACTHTQCSVFTSDISEEPKERALVLLPQLLGQREEVLRVIRELLRLIPELAELLSALVQRMHVLLHHTRCVGRVGRGAP